MIRVISPLSLHLNHLSRRFVKRGNCDFNTVSRFSQGRVHFPQQNLLNVSTLENSYTKEESLVDERRPQQQEQRQLLKSAFFPIYYNDIYKVQLPPNHRFPMEKYEKVRKRVQAKILDLKGSRQQQQNTAILRDNSSNEDLVRCEFLVSPLATVEELQTTHDLMYVTRFLEGNMTATELRNVGFPWSTSGVNRSLSSVGGTVAAAVSVCEQLVLQQKYQPQLQREVPLVWSAHVAGGTHHAFYDRGEGFCVFSDIAVAANVVLDRYPNLIQNVLIIDLDVHQGNGNAVLFQNRPNVFTFSMHCSGNYFSPKQHSDLDIELPVGCTDETFLVTLKHWLNRFRREHERAKTSNASPSGVLTSASTCSKSIRSRYMNTPSSSTWKIDMIFYQAGVDVLSGDRLGRFDLTPRGVQRRNELVYQFAADIQAPLVITMGGGYPTQQIPTTAGTTTTPKMTTETGTSTMKSTVRKNNHDIDVHESVDSGWESVIEAHTNVYVQAYTFLKEYTRKNKSKYT